MRAALRFVLAIIALALAPMAEAEDAALRSLETGDDGKGWEAVGRLNFSDRSFCTGALIAPDLVLTAAHCMFDATTGERMPADEIEFLAGWRGGRATAYRDVRRAVVHPNYAFNGGERLERVVYDIALLELSLPIRNTSVTPFATQTQPRKGAEVGVVSYAHDRAVSPSLQEVCHILARRAGMLILSCDVDFGSSGAPIFTMENGRPEIISVVSAKAMADEIPVALGTALEGQLELLMSELAKTDGVFRRDMPEVTRLGTGERTSGAKFVRPGPGE